MRRFFAIATMSAAIASAACGSGQKANSPAAPRQPTDPRNAPTATLPAALSSPIPAGTVADARIAANATVLPSVYVVKPGDTLAAIANTLGIPLQSLLSFNTDVNPSSLRVGQEIRIPPVAAATSTATTAVAGTRTATPAASVTALSPGASATPTTVASGAGNTTAQTYAVKAGDTACKVAADFHVSLAELAEANHMPPAALASLKVGQQLQIPAATGSPRGC